MMKKAWIILLAGLTAAAVWAEVIDDFDDTDLSQYTLSVVLEQSGTYMVWFASPAGTLQVSKGADSGAEQVVFLRSDVNLEIGDVLRVDTAGADSTDYADFGIAVSKTVDPPDAVWTSGTADARDGYLTIYLKPLYNSIAWAGYDGGNIGSSSGIGVTWADLTGLFIARTGANEYQGGYSTAGGDTVLVTWTPTSDMSAAGGFYADVRAETTYGDLDNLRIISAPMPPEIVTDPNDMTVHEGQTAIFTTVFTSQSEPSVTWYKVAEPDDLAMDPADVQTTYDAVAEQYTSTLTIAGASLSDAGQYYCQIINDTAVPQNSDTAALIVHGLVAHWTLNQSSYAGGYYLEEIGGYDAAVTGSPSFVTGADGIAARAVRITASDGWALCPPLDPVKQSGQMTISFWANWNQNTPVQQDLLAESSNGESLTDPDGLKADGRWQHICMVFGGSTAELYVDGLLRDQGPWLLPVDTEAAVNIGTGRDQQDSFNGAMDDLRIFNYALTGIEVADLRYALSGDRSCILTFADQYDLSGPEGRADCVINIYDLAAFAGQWLNLYDLSEFSDFSSVWQSSGLYPAVD